MDFTDVQSVTIGGQGLTGLSVVSSTSLTGTTPAGTAGARDVVVTTSHGSGSIAGGFTYVDIPAPTVTAIAPNKGPTAGGTMVTITGASFTDVQSVTIGGQSLTGLSVVSSTSLTGSTPANTAGAKDVVVTTAYGSGTRTGGFTYTAFPSQLGTAGYDIVSSVAADASGNVYVVGQTTGSFTGFTNAVPTTCLS
jgi:IPT/TIG domain-containing protein/beta-propeller repeat-containing protein